MNQQHELHCVLLVGMVAYKTNEEQRNRHPRTNIQGPLEAPIAKVDDARAESPRLEELELDLLFQSREVGAAATERDRTDEQPVLVYEPERGARSGQGGPADGQVQPRFSLQPARAG